MSALITPCVRPVTAELQKTIDEHARHGMKIIPIDSLGEPAALKRLMGIKKEDFVVCAFMGSRMPKGAEDIAEVVRLYPKRLAQLDHEYDLHMPRLCGGGSADFSGLMSKFALGATEDGHPAYFVTMQNIVEIEGLPLAPGSAVCLKQLPKEDRIGERGDGLICVGDLFIVFPGGIGTTNEVSALFTNTSVSNMAGSKKIVFFNPICHDPITGEEYRFLEDDLKSLKKKNQADLISNGAAKNINDHCLVYSPAKDLAPELMCNDLMALTFAIREAAPRYDPDVGYEPLTPNAWDRIPPLNPGSTLEKVFDHIDADWGWINGLSRIASNPNGSVPYPT
jgi:predicted Rossmann-fold nucleotide-binding protein